jgi:hypothetical protein
MTVSGDTLTIDLQGAAPVRLTEKLQPAFGTLFTPDILTALFLRDIGVLTSDFERLLTQSIGEFFLACFALLFLCTASMTLLRITRWPLINVLLYIVAVRAYFLLYHLLSVNLAPETVKVIANPMIARMFPSVAFTVIGVVFLLIDILFVPADRSAQERTA